MNRKTILAIFFLVVCLSVADADQFQILYKAGNDEYYVSDTSTNVYDANGKIVSNVYTDEYGRVEINISNGTYSARLVYRGKERNVTIVIDGSSYLKKVYIEG
jgi:hypothetical protein